MTASVGGMLLVTALMAAPGPDPSPRIRSSHPYIRAMLAEAQVRSATFRRLVNDIEATDGIVYVEEGVCGHGLRSCLPLVVTPAAGFRILRVLVDPRQPDWDVMSSIGHELQHTLEVLSDRHVTTNEAIYFLFSKGNPWRGGSFETREALKITDAIRSEVVAFARN